LSIECHRLDKFITAVINSYYIHNPKAKNRNYQNLLFFIGSFLNNKVLFIFVGTSSARPRLTSYYSKTSSPAPIFNDDEYYGHIINMVNKMERLLSKQPGSTKNESKVLIPKF